MELSDEFYAQVVAGTADPGELRLRAGLVRRRIRRALHEAVADRMTALKATRSLDARQQTDLVSLFLVDEDASVRKFALNLAIAAEEAGTRVLRDAIRTEYNDVRLTALDFLTRGVDKSSTSRVAPLLASGDSDVRVAATRFLGHAAGASFLPRVTRMLADPDPRVAHAAELAISRLEGKLERRAPQPWWTADPLPPEDPNDHTVPPPDLAEIALIPPDAEPGALTALPALADLAPPEPTATSLPALLPPGNLIGPEEEWEPATPSPLPDPLPSEARALGRLLSRVAAADRGVLLQRLKTLGEDRIVVDALTRSTDPLDRAAAAVAVQRLALKGRVTNTLRLLRDSDPRVRIAAAMALADLAGVSALAQLARVLHDEEPVARRAAALSLARAARRLDEPRLAERSLVVLEASHEESDAEILQAARDILHG